jgi:hypothetical protein
MLTAVKIPFIGKADASVIVAALALVVSIIALLRPWWVEWRRNRKASNHPSPVRAATPSPSLNAP